LASQRARPALQRPLLGQLGDVGAGHERLGPGPGHDDAANVVTARYELDGLAELGHREIVQRVQFVRAVHGDRGHPVVHVEGECVEGHEVGAGIPKM
jgi:hypothetical protein